MKRREPRVSVVLLTKNSARTVRKTLDSISQQTRMPDEVIVVDGNSGDGTLDIVKGYPVKVVVEPGLGYEHARNLDVREAMWGDEHAQPPHLRGDRPHHEPRPPTQRRA